MKIKQKLLAICLFLLLPMPALAVDSKLTDGNLPVKINADDMVYDVEKSRVTFTGNVVVTRGAFNMQAPKMTIFLKKTQKNEQIEIRDENIPLTGKVQRQTKTVNSQEKIDKIEAYNGVKFDFETQTGSSQTATYDASQGILTLKGNPVVQDGNNSIRGNTILYYLYERRSEVVGSGKKRVEAIFDPNK